MWKKALGVAGVGLLALCAVLAVGVFTGVPVPDQAAPAFDLGAVRGLAGPGGPSALHGVEVVAGEQQEMMLFVGGGLGKRPMPVVAVELRWDDGRSVLLEPATDDHCSEGFLPVASFDRAAWDRMQQAMRRAEAIVATHEHFDHLCGLTRSPFLDELAGKAVLPPGQLDGTAYMTAADPSARARLRPTPLDAPTRLAPGVVLIPAPGHTPGSLWVYVRTQEGAELLFVGDTVWKAEALERVAPKPRIIGWVGGEDAEAQAGLLRFLVDLRREHPEVEVVVAHDEHQWARLRTSGLLRPL